MSRRAILPPLPHLSQLAYPRGNDEQVLVWKWDSWIGNGSLDMELAEAEDRGTMIQTTLNTDEAIVYFQAPVTYHLSDWVDGSVEFDMRLVEKGKAPGFRVRVDCVHPFSSSDFPIAKPDIGEWVRYVVPISDLLSNSGSSLDLTLINTPLVFFPTWGSQDGAVIQIDNVRWTR